MSSEQDPNQNEQIALNPAEVIEHDLTWRAHFCRLASKMSLKSALRLEALPNVILPEHVMTLLPHYQELVEKNTVIGYFLDKLSVFVRFWLFGLSKTPDKNFEVKKLPFFSRLHATYAARHMVPMCGLNTLNEDNAAILSKLKSSFLELSSVPRIDHATALAISEFGGVGLYLNGLQNVQVGVAKALSAFRGRSLALNGLQRINPEVAEALSLSNAKALRLNGLNEIDGDVAAALGSFNGDELSLDGVLRVDSVTASALSRFSGKLSMAGLSGYFSVLSELDVPEAKLMVSVQDSIHISFGLLKHVTPEVAAVLCSIRGGLKLDDLEHLDLATAAALKKCRFPLSFRGLSGWDLGVAHELSGCEGVLFVPQKLRAEIDSVQKTKN